MRAVLLSIVLLAFSQAYSQRTLLFYEIGPYHTPSGPCKKEAEQALGIRMEVTGCCVSGKMVRHNRRIERKLVRRWGEDWHIKFCREISECRDPGSGEQDESD